MKSIVLGMGSMGAAACAHLARKGVKVLGLDQFEPPHEAGSHHGGARMIRQSYFEHPDYVPLLIRAYELWRELEKESGRSILYEAGGLYMGPPGAVIVEGAQRAAREHGLPHEILDAREIRRRFPPFHIPGDFTGLYEERAGYLLPGEAIRAHLEVARRNGAVLRSGEEVLGWEGKGDGIEVATACGLYRADRLVVTAGPWAARFLGDLGVHLQVTRQPLAWMDVADAAPFTLGRFPCWFIETQRPWGHYGFPIWEGEPRLKFALHRPGRECLPDEPMESRAEPGELPALREFACTYFGEAGRGDISTQLCRYTNSPDQHFLVGRHSEDPRVVLGAGFSGHGFKFASVIGEVLAELAIGGETRHAIQLLNPARFRSNDGTA